MATFTVDTDGHTTVHDVTDRVRDALPADADGACTVFCEHTTAGLVVNEAEPRLLEDIETFVAGLAPDDGWAHDELDGNADSHLRALLLGESVTVPVVDGDLDLGRWQSVLLVECDGPRERTVRVLAE
ncbi:secondary thiamine-phosphate synthase enzyme YjbQ [Halobaculum lipolyticum]|uniref:Secondary thiamine-phosphate synthase enzyme YjbQ n=1 Tax=Halobaculum lipolyticum TaxID=3032001 RepID=A0ABD5W9U1_9EURY|nr:secondary thiamine-phosphate synthase enzyme YjbQ [Halobaculum sp. DT31]